MSDSNQAPEVGAIIEGAIVETYRGHRETRVRYVEDKRKNVRFPKNLRGAFPIGQRFTCQLKVVQGNGGVYYSAHEATIRPEGSDKLAADLASAPAAPVPVLASKPLFFNDVTQPDPVEPGPIAAESPFPNRDRGQLRRLMGNHEPLPDPPAPAEVLNGNMPASWLNPPVSEIQAALPKEEEPEYGFFQFDHLPTGQALCRIFLILMALPLVIIAACLMSGAGKSEG